MADGQYRFAIGLDDQQLTLDVEKAKKVFDDLVKAAREAGAKIDESFENPFNNLVPPASLPQQTAATAQSFHGLNVATQQIVRELPAATIGLNTFFLAISNNLPIFADQIKAANAANKSLAAEGKPTISVFKQIVSSLFSWQSGMVIAITLLTTFGSKIADWVSSLFSANDATDAAAKAQEGLNKALAENGLGIGDLIANYKELQKAWVELGDNLQAQREFIDENAEALRELGVVINDVADADALFIEQSDEFMRAMRLRAEATAAQELAAEQYEASMRAELELEQKRAELERYNANRPWYDSDVARDINEWSLRAQMNQGRGHLSAAMQTWLFPSLEQEVAQLEAQKRAADETADAYIALMREREEEAAQLLNNAGIELIEEGTEERAAALRDRAAILTDLQQRLQRDADQAIIDMMAEGTDRELAQIAYDYERKRAEIARQEEALRKEQGALTDLQALQFGVLRTAAHQEYLDAMELAIFGDTDEQARQAFEHIEASRRAWNEYLEEYGTFQERLRATTIRYNEAISAAETEGERRAIEAERDAVLAQFEVEASTWAQDLVGKTIGELNSMVEQIQAQIEAKRATFDAMESSDTAEAQALMQEIATLNAQILVLRERLGEATEAASNSDWAEATHVFQNINQAALDAADGIAEFDENLAEALRSIAELSSLATNMIGAIQGVMKAFAEGMGAIEKASAILAVVGAVIQAFSGLLNLFKRSDEVGKTMRQFQELNDELERMHKLARIDSLEGTIFGEDAFGNFANNLSVMRDALNELNATKNAVETDRYNRELAYLQALLAQYQQAGDVRGIEYIEQRLAELEASGLASRTLYDAIATMNVSLGGGKYSTLEEQLPSLFEGGEVSLDALRELQESDVWDKLSKENRTLIEELIADWEQFEEATTAVEKYLTNIFGELGNEINDAIVDAFANGTDAAVAFGDIAGKMLENLIKQIGYTAYIAPILSKAMEDVEALNGQDLSAEDYLNALMGIVGDTMKAAEEAVDGYNEFLDRSDKIAEGQGINTFDGERTAVAKGIAQASQDSVDELNGRMTAVQSHTSMLVDGQKQLIHDSAQILDLLAGIESNTGELHSMRKDMTSMSKDMRSMSKDISDMATRGIITR